MENKLTALEKVSPELLESLIVNTMKRTGRTNPEEAIKLVLSGEWLLTGPERGWTEEGDIIRFTVKSNGYSGEKIINNAKNKWYKIDEDALYVLRSEDFRTSNNVTYNIAVIKGKPFKNKKFNFEIEEVLKLARKLKFKIPPALIAPLIREKFSDRDLASMGYHRIVIMHQPIKCSCYLKHRLSVNWEGHGSYLGVDPQNFHFTGKYDNGFAFVEKISKG